MKRPPPILLLPNGPPSIEPTGASTMMSSDALGLSNAQVRQLIGPMRAMISAADCPEHLHEDALQDAFILAASKPISERPAVSNWEGFVAWMCTVAKYAALTNRNTERRSRETDELTEENATERLIALPQVNDVLARDVLRAARVHLTREDEELLDALYFEGRSIADIAKKQGRAWTTVKSRLERVLGVLRLALRSGMIAFVLLIAKTARAQGTRFAWRMSTLVPQLTPGAYVLAVTVGCGVFIQGNTVAMSVRQDAQAASLEAPAMTATVSTEVAPVKPIALDEPVEPWSASAMNSTKIAVCLQAAVVPFAFLVAPMMTLSACAGTEQHVTPPQKAADEEVDDDPGRPDRYEQHCTILSFRGEVCESRAEWCASMGMRPGPKGCQ